jgi:hypothetical protein
MICVGRDFQLDCNYDFLVASGSQPKTNVHDSYISVGICISEVLQLGRNLFFSCKLIIT